MRPPGYVDTVHPETDSSIVVYSGLVPGATNIKAAVDKVVEVKTATITTTWTGASAPYTQVITVAGMTANDRPMISPVYDAALATAIAQKEAWNMVSKITTQAGSMVVTCFEEKPTVAIPIQIKGV